MAENAQKRTITFNTIDSLIQMIKSDKKYKEAIKQVCNNYNVSQYKINKIRLQEIPEITNLIQLNYINLQKDTEHIQHKKKNFWLANQLKLFLWMAICHSYLSNKPLEKYNEEDWICFSYIFTKKTISELEFQIKSIFKNFHGNKEKWDQEEKELLKLIIEDNQNKNKWNQVSRLLYLRSNKKYYRAPQKCRQYWFNHIDPCLNKNPWTIDEELKLVKIIQTYGFKWSKLTQIIESNWGYRRTEHMVKNRAKILCKRYGFNDQKEQGCLKELARIQKKLLEKKLKSSESITSIKEEDSDDSKEPAIIKPETQKFQEKKLTTQKAKNKKQLKKELSKRQKKRNLDQSEKSQSKAKLDLSSSKQDFQNVGSNKKASKTKQSHNKRNVIIIFHPKNQDSQKKYILNSNEPVLMQEEDSNEIAIGQHIEKGLQRNKIQQDDLKHSVFQNEHNIVKDMEENPNIDLRKYRK